MSQPTVQTEETRSRRARTGGFGRRAVPLALFLFLALGGCNREKGAAPPSPGPAVSGGEGTPAVMEGKNQAGTEQQKVRVDLLKADLQEMLKRYDAEITKMKDQMSGVNEATKEKYQQAIAVLDEQRKKGAALLQEVEEASADKWGEVEKKAQDALNKMREAYDRVVQG